MTENDLKRAAMLDKIVYVFAVGGIVWFVYGIFTALISG